MEHTRRLTLLVGLFISVSAQSNSIDHCLKITNSSDRLSCYDQVFGYKKNTGVQVVSTAVTVHTVGKSIPQPIERPVTKKNTVNAAQKAYDLVIANSQTMKVVKVTSTKSKKVYYYTDTGRLFRKNTDRTVNFKVNDQVRIENGFLAAQFLVNQAGTKIKIKEIEQ